MKFYKYQGAGNDFLIADNRDGQVKVCDAMLSDGTGWSRSIADLCDRRYGVGADGLMLLEPGRKTGSTQTDFTMTYFNSDGSGGMMCGNGGRCIVAFAAEMGVQPLREDGTYLFEAADGLHVAEILEDADGVRVVRLKMKDVGRVERHESLTGVDSPSEGWFMDTGTRHFVRVVDGLEEYDIVKEGRDIRYNARELQPVGANVNFIEADGNILKVRTYEKGVEDETFACGTGIVASAVAAFVSGLEPSERRSDSVIYDIHAKRDDLSVEFSPSGGNLVAENVWLTGPAAYVAEILFAH